jgi:gluconolactonase
MRGGEEISRRKILEFAAGGGVTLAASGFGRARAAESTPRIDRFDPEFDKILSTSEPVRTLATGLGGGANTEGPVWWKEGGFLLFSSIGDNRVLKYTPGMGISVYREKTNGANGHTRDMQGRLVSCEGFARRVTREEPDGSMTVIANAYHGKQLNKPNDVVVKSDGSTYFTDPWNIPALPQAWDLDFNGVYRVSPDLGTVNLLTRDLVLPNGLAFSPDERILYIGDSRRVQIFAFDVMPNGLLANQSQRVFVELKGPEPGVPDGFKVDMAGNVFTGGSGGVYVVSPSGKKLGRITMGEHITNVAFGGDDWKTLYFTTHSTLNAVQLRSPGLPVPARTLKL